MKAFEMKELISAATAAEALHLDSEKAALGILWKGQLFRGLVIYPKQQAELVDACKLFLFTVGTRSRSTTRWAESID